MVEFTTDGLVYEALLRHFRNAVVDHIRTCLERTYGAEAVERLRKPFTDEEWEGAVASEEAARQLGYVTRQHQDEFDYIGVNHFYNIFDANFDVLLPADELPAAEFRNRVKRDMLGWLLLIKGVRDPVSHPASDEMPVTDAVRVVDLAGRLLQRLHLAVASDKVTQIYTELVRRTAASAPPDPLQGGFDDTLPAAESIVIDFVGRDDELKSLWSWVLGETSNRWMLAGDGGKGKSAIAFRFATHVRAFKPQPLCGVFWMTAKRRRFADGATMSASPADFWDLDSALNKILGDYGWPEETTRSIEVKKSTVLTLLEELPTLVVVDDLDSIPPEDEDVVEFFTLEAPRARSRILITSRRLFAGMGRTCTTIGGLDGNDAIEFLRTRAQLLDISGSTLNDTQRREIAAICEGSPLYMEDFLRLSRFLPYQDARDAWQSHQGVEARRYALEREVGMLSAHATDVLRVCAVADQPLSLLELDRITGQGADATLAAVDELRRMYLVPAPELIEEIPRLQANRNLALLVRDTLDDAQLARVSAAISRVLGYPTRPSETKSVGDYCRQARVLVSAERHREAEETLKAGLEKHPTHPRLLGMLGWVYWRSKPTRRADARDQWQRAYELGSRDRAMYLNWSNMEAEEERWQSAAEAADKGLERFGENDARLLQAAGYSRSRFGQSLVQSFNRDRGAQELERADRLLRRSVQRAIREQLTDFDISRAFRSWLLNAQVGQASDDVCARLAEWLNWNREDPGAIKELETQRHRCPEILEYIGGTDPK